MAKSSNPIACFVCGGSYTADQRRRHEDTRKHQEAMVDPSSTPEDTARYEAFSGDHAVAFVPGQAGVGVRLVDPVALTPSQDAAQRKVDKFAMDRFLDWRWRVLRPETYSKEQIAKAETRFLNAAMLASEATLKELDKKQADVFAKAVDIAAGKSK